MKEGIPISDRDKVKKNLSNIEKLLEYEKQGCVFHGSPRKDIEMLEPKRSRDIREGKGFNKDTAVFGTKSVVEATIYACVDRNAIPREIEKNMLWLVGSSLDRFQIVARIPVKWKPYVMKGSGHVYVFDKEPFTFKRDWHVKSRKSVKPIDAIKVEFSDFEKLGGVIEWKEGTP